MEDEIKSQKNRLIFRIVCLGAVAMTSGALLLLSSVTQVSQIIVSGNQSQSALFSIGGVTIGWSSIIAIACISVSFTCLVASAQTISSLIKLYRTNPGNVSNENDS